MPCQGHAAVGLTCLLSTAHLRPHRLPLHHIRPGRPLPFPGLPKPLHTPRRALAELGPQRRAGVRLTRITSTTSLRPHRLQIHTQHPLFHPRLGHTVARKRRGLRAPITQTITPPLAPTTSTLSRSTHLPRQRQPTRTTRKPLSRNHIRSRKIRTQHIIHTTTRNLIPVKTQRLLSTRRINQPRPHTNRRLSPLQQSPLRIRRQRIEPRQAPYRLVSHLRISNACKTQRGRQLPRKPQRLFTTELTNLFCNLIHHLIQRTRTRQPHHIMSPSHNLHRNNKRAR